jgi:hypothetical protein
MAKWQGSRVEAVPHCHFSHGYHYLEKLHGGRGRNLLILGSRPGGDRTVAKHLFAECLRFNLPCLGAI